MPRYYVKWDINLDADSPEDAALQALGIHRDPESIATVFRVVDEETQEGVLIDVDELDED